MGRTAALVIGLALLGGCSESTAPSGAPPAAIEPVARGTRSDIDVTALERGLDSDTVRLLVDVRTEAEYRGGHVPGAIHIPLADLDRRSAELGPPDQGPVHLICQSGGRSSAAADQLVAKGYAVLNVAGGTGGWRAAGHPLE